MIDESRDRRLQAGRRRVPRTIGEPTVLGVFGTIAATPVTDRSEYHPIAATGAVVKRRLMTIDSSDVREDCPTAT